MVFQLKVVARAVLAVKLIKLIFLKLFDELKGIQTVNYNFIRRIGCGCIYFGKKPGYLHSTKSSRSRSPKKKLLPTTALSTSPTPQHTIITPQQVIKTTKGIQQPKRIYTPTGDLTFCTLSLESSPDTETPEIVSSSQNTTTLQRQPLGLSLIRLEVEF